MIKNYLILFGIICLIVLLVLIYLKITAKKRFQKYVEKSNLLIPLIAEFNADVDLLESKYTTHKEELELKNKWASFYSEVFHQYFPTKIPNYKVISRFLYDYSNINEIVREKNEIFIENEIIKQNDILSNIDGKSLDNQQRRVVVSEEDRTLVLAGAGSGKTLTIAAKVKYLCEVKNVDPKDILLISFTNKSAAEMTERIQKKLGIPVEATTFHKLGLNIITKALGSRPDIYDDLDSFVHRFFEEDLLKYPELVEKIAEFFIYYLDIPEDMDNCSSLDEYYELEKSADLETLKSKYAKEKYIEQTSFEKAGILETLNGEHVKSLEETKIANFLFMHGVNYEYEKLYPFESDDPLRKAYRPDFYLPDYDIYLEHFGISRDFKLPWLSEVEEAKYIDGIKWKRDFHKRNGTKLLETYSYYQKEGVLLRELENLLLQNGVEFKERDFKDIFENIYAKKSNKYFSEFISLCCTFIVLFKSNDFKRDQFEKFKKESFMCINLFMYERTCLFMDIISSIYDEYQKYLSDNKAIDFSDMINEAADKVQNGTPIHKYKYVIVDEYQDISQSRFHLLKSIVDASGAKVLCVGDDWQSIYRFAGSDISLFTNFEKYLGYTNILRIEKTYRNSQQLINEASWFVTRNPNQLSKSLKSEKILEYPLVFWGYNEEPYVALNQIIQKIIMDFGVEKSILLLGRTNYDIEILRESGLFNISSHGGTDKITYKAVPQLPVTFLSVHKSKGLEADNVIVLNFKNDKLGFPNQIADDKLLNFVLTQGEQYLYAEERRLFYVAITRTKNRTFVLTDNKKPSIFLREFNESESCCFIRINNQNDISKTHCPRCKGGELIKIKNNEGKTFIGCTNFPKCRYTLNDATILSSPKQCPSCGGFLVKRKGARGHWFIGCTNYPYCEHTEEIKIQ